MKTIAHFEKAFEEIRKKTSFREFLSEVASWQPITLYRRSVGVSRYPDTKRFGNVVSSEEYEKLKDGLLRNSQDARSDRPLFEVMAERFQTTPMPALFSSTNDENSEYADCAGHTKNAYLSIIANHGENMLYSFSIKSANDVYNSAGVWDGCENVYCSSGVTGSSNVFYSRYLDACRDVWFCRNLIGCTECLFCEGLENASFHINNVPHTREEYFTKKAAILAQKSKFEAWYAAMPKDSRNLSSANSTGTFVSMSENVENGHWIYHVKDARNAIFTGGKTEKTDLYDTVTCGATGHMYATLNGKFFSEYVYASSTITQSSHVFYSYNLVNCMYCIGCVGLINRSHCIYNEQYSPEEWFELATKIFESMQKEGTFGRFFPSTMNPFYFNDTVASFVDDSFSQEEVTKAGFLWRTETIRADIPPGSEVISTAELEKFESMGKNGWAIDPEVLKKVVKDPNGNLYRITFIEREFLLRYELPLPRTHWADRMRQAIGMR
jgi:hypothetical protein